MLCNLNLVVCALGRYNTQVKYIKFYTSTYLFKDCVFFNYNKISAIKKHALVSNRTLWCDNVDLVRLS